MKIKQTIILGAGTLLVGTFYAITQISPESNQSPPIEPAPGEIQEGFPRLYSLDIDTWAVVELPADHEQNNLEHRRERQLSAFAFQHPEEYRQLYPLTPEQEQAGEEARLAMSDPVAFLARVNATKPAEQLAEEARIQAEFGNVASQTTVPP